MSIESLAIALHHSQARGTAKLVLVGIANHDGDGGAFPKIATLAKYANVHPRRVVEALRTLGELGEITIEAQEGGSKSTPDAIRPNKYELVLECPPECDRSKHHRIQGEKVGRSYAGQYDQERAKDPERVERGRKARQTFLARQAQEQALAAAAAEDIIMDTQGAPSAENSTRSTPVDNHQVEGAPSAENSTRSSAENSTRSSAENSTTKNHPKKPPEEPGYVPTSPGAAAASEHQPAPGAGQYTNGAAPGPDQDPARGPGRQAVRDMLDQSQRKSLRSSIDSRAGRALGTILAGSRQALA